MSFNGQEGSPNAGRPFHLYRFKFGPAGEDEVYYTNVALEYEFDEMVFAPLAITHGEIVSSGNLDKSSLPVMLPDDTVIGELYAGSPPSYVVTLTIWQGHFADGDFKVCFAGRVLGGTFADNTLELDCEPIVSSLRRTGLTRDYQYACPLVLYGSRCRASKVAATRTADVVSLDGPLVTLPSDWAPTDLKAKHLGGIAQWVNPAGRTQIRSIVDVNENILLLSSVPEGLVADDTLTLILGCNHLMDDCRDVHDNILNFGGQHEIPLTNPIGITNSFY